MLEKLLEEIRNGQRINISDVKLTLTDYLTKDENGISFLEHLLKNNILIQNTIGYQNYIKINQKRYIKE